MYSFRKSKKGFTLIELMVVVVIIGILALLGLRLYLTQIAKSNNALIKANAGTVQTAIQAALADEDATSINNRWVDHGVADSIIDETGIHNPMTKLIQQDAETSATVTVAGQVWVDWNETAACFYINGLDAAGVANVYTPENLVAKY